MAKKTTSNAPGWYESGLKHTWLPYTQMQTAPLPQAVIATQGCRIKLADGRELIDGISSWWTACHGYNHPAIAKAVSEQLTTMPHVMFAGLVHEPALKLAEKLCAIAPVDLNRVFFSDSGSVSVEVALKMALQYWRNKEKPARDRFLCFTNGYHGDTFGAMSVSDPEKSMHKAFRHAIIHQYVVDIPSDEYGFSEFDALMGGIHREVAGIIIEPLVQGAGGMRFHSPDTLAEIARIAKKHDVLFIADEIATGFGRTGSMFACEEAGVTPDILCVGKALTGGTVSLAATMAREEIFEAFLSDSTEAALMHGPTYMANPLACAAALASIEIFETEDCLAKIEKIERQMRDELSQCETLTGVSDVRVKGAIAAIQLEGDIDLNWLRARFVEEGVWVRPLKDVIYLMPPFCVSSEELSTLTAAVKKITGEWSKSPKAAVHPPAD